jgi:putative hydrolase of the HAD superfamily
MVNPKIKAIISDLGGVLINLEYDRFIKAFINKKPTLTKEVLFDSLYDMKLMYDLHSGKLDGNGIYNYAIDKLEMELTFDEFKKIWNDIMSLNSPMVEFLKNKKEKYRLIMLSNIGPIHHENIEQNFKEVLFFHDYVLSYMTGYAKPDKEIYELAIKKSKCKPNQCLFIDDLEENIDAARKSGIQTIHFKNFKQFEKEFYRLGL